MNGCCPSPIDEEKEKYSEWRVRDAVETLMRAEEVKADSKMMALVKAEMAKKGNAIKRITSLKELRAAAGRKPKSESMESEGVDETKEESED